MLRPAMVAVTWKESTGHTIIAESASYPRSDKTRSQRTRYHINGYGSGLYCYARNLRIVIVFRVQQRLSCSAQARSRRGCNSWRGRRRSWPAGRVHEGGKISSVVVVLFCGGTEKLAQKPVLRGSARPPGGALTAAFCFFLRRLAGSAIFLSVRRLRNQLGWMGKNHTI